MKEREVLMAQFDEIIRMDIENPSTSIKARNLRLLIQRNRNKWNNEKDVSIIKSMLASLERIENYPLVREIVEEQITEDSRLYRISRDRYEKAFEYSIFWDKEKYDFKSMTDGEFLDLMQSFKTKQAKRELEINQMIQTM